LFIGDQLISLIAAHLTPRKKAKQRVRTIPMPCEININMYR